MFDRSFLFRFCAGADREFYLRVLSKVAIELAVLSTAWVSFSQGFVLLGGNLQKPRPPLVPPRMLHSRAFGWWKD